MFGKETERYKNVHPLVQALDRRNLATPCADRAGNREIVLEAMRLYQICKKKYLHWTAKGVVSSVHLGAGIATTASTFGISTLATYGSFHTSLNKKDIWQALKNQCKRIGASAAEYADLGFTRRRESPLTCIKPLVVGFLTMGLDDVYHFLNSD